MKILITVKDAPIGVKLVLTGDPAILAIDQKDKYPLFVDPVDPVPGQEVDFLK